MNILFKFIISFTLLGGYTLFLTGCAEESPLQVTRSESGNPDNSLLKRSAVKGNTNVIIQIASGTVYFKPSLNDYVGLGFGHPNGSSFILQPEALTPPEDIPWGEDVTITMTVEKDLLNGRLIYTFEPSGCQFEPAAVLWISWSDLGTDTATLYSINNKNRYVRETPEVIDYDGKKFQVRISHFSRYAVAYSD